MKRRIKYTYTSKRQTRNKKTAKRRKHKKTCKQRGGYFSDSNGGLTNPYSLTEDETPGH